MSALSGLGTFASETLRLSVPYAFAALGGTLSERSGVPHIALEGVLLTSAFGAIAVHLATGSSVLGLVAGAITGAVVGALHAATVVRGGVDAIVSGVALNLGALGVTRFLLRALYGSSANSPSVAGFGLALPSALRVLLDPFTVLLVLCTLGVAWLLRRTRFGLEVRAVGAAKEAAHAVGVPVARTQAIAVAFGSLLAGLGGAALAYDQHQFQAQMSGGRGFIALAAVILARYRPEPAVLACLVFAALDALQVVLQAHTRLPTDLVTALPYVATLFVLIVAGRRKRSPVRPG